MSRRLQKRPCEEEQQGKKKYQLGSRSRVGRRRSGKKEKRVGEEDKEKTKRDSLARFRVFTSPGTSCWPISAHLMISTLR